MKKLFLILLFSFLFLNSCKDRDDFMAYSSEKVEKKFFLRGDGVWNIDEFHLWTYDQQSSVFVSDELRTNLGTIKFKKDNLFDLNFTNDTVSFKYINFGTLKDYYWSYSLGNFDWKNPVEDPIALAHVVTIDKKNMILYFPSKLNTFVTTKGFLGRDVEFRLKLTKK